MSGRFEVRFMKPDETSRVSELIKGLHDHQKMKHVPRIPLPEDIHNELVHLDEKTGQPVGNKNGSFTVVAVDKEKSKGNNHYDVVGYMVYTVSFNIISGKCFWMNSFFIESDYRRVGLGKKMMEFVRLHGKAIGAKILNVPYMKNNTVGHKFYNQYDFKNIDEQFEMYHANMVQK